MDATMNDGGPGEFHDVTFSAPGLRGMRYTAIHEGHGNYALVWSDMSGKKGRLGGYSHTHIAARFADGAWAREAVDANSEIHGYIPLFASLASVVAEVFTSPTREASRGYVDMAVRSLRGEPFAKAVQATLISLVGDRITVFPSPNEIMATVDACHAWEHARGQVAPGKRSLNRAEMRELTEVARLAAWARVNTRDACDIGEIVAETYERVRSTC